MCDSMSQHESLSVEWRAIADVRPYPGNPRVIPETAIKKVAASIKAFGWRQPIVVDEVGEILVGHTRLLAAKRLKLKRVPVHTATGLSEAEAKAYRLADNRTGEETSWDPVGLKAELGSIGALGFDLGLTGFDPLELPQGLAGEQEYRPSVEPTSAPLDRLTEFTCPHCGKAFDAGSR